MRHFEKGGAGGGHHVTYAILAQLSGVTDVDRELWCDPDRPIITERSWAGKVDVVVPGLWTPEISRVV